MKLMKNLLAIVSSILLAAAVSAQEKPAPDKADAKPAPRPNRPTTIDRSAALANFLKLSDEQKTKIKPILDEEVSQQQALRQDKALTPESRMAKVKEIRESTSAKVKPILNDEQWQKWEKMRNPRVNRPATPAAPGAPAPAPAPAPAK